MTLPKRIHFIRPMGNRVELRTFGQMVPKSLQDINTEEHIIVRIPADWRVESNFTLVERACSTHDTYLALVLPVPILRFRFPCQSNRSQYMSEWHYLWIDTADQEGTPQERVSIQPKSHIEAMRLAEYEQIQFHRVLPL